MKKSLLKRSLFVLMAIAMVIALVACGGGGSKTPGKTDENVKNKVKDDTKTQLYLHYYKAGYGSNWVDNLIQRFEEAYASTSFEAGKTGIQVWPTGDMQGITSNYIKENTFDVYQIENGTYTAYVNDDSLLDISDVVNGVSTIDNLSIASKLNEQQKNAYAIGGKYYAVPQFSGNYGFIYNMDLFEEKGWWIASDGTYCTKASGKTLGTGPDGYTGTSDDGLPATFDEFFDLCDTIVSDGCYAYSWPQKYYSHYCENVMDSIVKNINGYDQAMLNYTFNGTATNLVDENGNLLDPVEINETNAYELAKQAGKYYGLEFLYRMLDGSNGYYPNPANAFGGSKSHTDNQQDFLMDSTALGRGTPIAMLVDGPWWQAEAKAVFDYMTGKNADYSQYNRNFGWLPLPKPNQEYVDNHLTTLQSDSLNTIFCVKKTTSLPEAAKAFVQFAYSNESLNQITQDTGAKVGVNYTISTDSTKLSTFSKDFLNQCMYSGVDGMAAKNGTETGEMLFEVSSKDLFNSNFDSLRSIYAYGNQIGGSVYKCATEALKQKGVDQQTYYKAFIEFFKTKIAWPKA